MKKPKSNWIDHRGKSDQTKYIVRASKNNPYICDHCGYRTTRYGNMIGHLERVHRRLLHRSQEQINCCPARHRSATEIVESFIGIHINLFRLPS